MKKTTLAFELRKAKRKGTNRELRRTGKIPAVVYGAHQPFPIAIDEREFNKKFKVVSENTIITLQAPDQQFEVLIKDYQEDIIKHKILHLDFYAIDKNKSLRTHVPVRLIGTPIGVKEGGMLEHLLHEVEVECLPADLPEQIELEVSSLGIHHSIHVRELPPLQSVRYLNSPDQVVCHVVTKAIEVEVPKEEALAATAEAPGTAQGEQAQSAAEAKKKE